MDKSIELSPAVGGHGLHVLCQRLNNEAPIAPYVAFEVSNRGLVSTFSVLLTYIIVLIQFKLSGS